MPYQSSTRLADLLLQRGDIAARGELERGRAWGGAVQNIGNIAANSLAGLIQYQQDAPRRELEAMELEDRREQIQSRRATADENRQIGQLLQGSVTPEGTVDRQRFMTGMKELNLGHRVADLMTMLDKVDPPRKLIERDPTKNLEYEDTGEVVRAGTPKPPEPYTLAPGAQRRGANNEVLAEAPLRPLAPPAPPSLGSFEDFVARKYGPQPTPDQIVSARKLYQQADDRPLAPIVIQTPTGPGIVNRGAGTVSPVTDGSGAPIGPAPTEGERNEARQYAKAKPILGSISELSERINTQQGAIAKISGAAERAKARVNLNDDVAEYESLISGFTPLIARALGHTGVLTEQDVQSVKAMFPRPGDSKSLRDRKVARIEQLMGQIEAATSSRSAPAGGGEFDWDPSTGTLRPRGAR